MSFLAKDITSIWTGTYNPLPLPSCHQLCSNELWDSSFDFFGRGDDLSFLPIISLASEEHYSFPLLRLVRASFWVLHFLVAGSDSQDRDYILSSLLVILSWEIAWPYEENRKRECQAKTTVNSISCNRLTFTSSLGRNRRQAIISSSSRSS